LAYRSGWIAALEQEAAALAVPPLALLAVPLLALVGVPLLAGPLLDEMLEQVARRPTAATAAVADAAARLNRLPCLFCSACLMGPGLPSSRSRKGSARVVSIRRHCHNSDKAYSIGRD
jgi:hypothetical protein